MSTPPHYLLASRQGLYLVNRDGYRLLAEGRFFGVVCLDGEVYAFLNTAADRSDDSEGAGCIVGFSWNGADLTDQRTCVSGLDHNCHQIDAFDDAFFVVDTFHQRVLEYDPLWRLMASHQILPPAGRRGPGHAHINSIAGDADRVFVMHHNGDRAGPSEIVEFNRRFEERNRTPLPCNGCHDIAPLEDGRLLTCLSPEGQLALVSGETFPIDRCWTRGLAVGPDEIAVGSSYYGARVERTLLPGFVTFLARDFRQTARIHVPAAPTQIRCFDVSPTPRR